MQACAAGQAELAQLLITAKADISAVDSTGFSPIVHAVVRSQARVVQVLLKSGVQPASVRASGLSLISLAVR